MLAVTAAAGDSVGIRRQLTQWAFSGTTAHFCHGSDVGQVTRGHGRAALLAIPAIGCCAWLVRNRLSALWCGSKVFDKCELSSGAK